MGIYLSSLRLISLPLSLRDRTGQLLPWRCLPCAHISPSSEHSGSSADASCLLSAVDGCRCGYAPKSPSPPSFWRCCGKRTCFTVGVSREFEASGGRYFLVTGEENHSSTISYAREQFRRKLNMQQTDEHKSKTTNTLIFSFNCRLTASTICFFNACLRSTVIVYFSSRLDAVSK